jgi:hypothetical protein
MTDDELRARFHAILVAMRPDLRFASDQVQIYEAAIALVREVERAQGCCIWAEDEDGNWDAHCGQKFTFSHLNGPLTDGFRWCPYCGKTLAEKPYTEPEVQP